MNDGEINNKMNDGEIVPNLPDVEAHIYLSEAGYQLDLYIRLAGYVKYRTTCRDFSFEYKVDEIVESVAAAIENAMKNFENSLR